MSITLNEAQAGATQPQHLLFLLSCHWCSQWQKVVHVRLSVLFCLSKACMHSRLIDKSCPSLTTVCSLPLHPKRIITALEHLMDGSILVEMFRCEASDMGLCMQTRAITSSECASGDPSATAPPHPCAT